MSFHRTIGPLVYLKVQFLIEITLLCFQSSLVQIILSSVRIMCYLFHLYFCFSYLLFGYEDKICVLIVSVHSHRLLFTFVMF